MTDTNESPVGNTVVKKTFLIPLVLFLLLIVILGAGFQLKDPHILPSVLIDRPFPEFSLKSIDNPARIITKQDLVGKVSLVNVWATWCPNCIMEHPELLRISREEDVAVIGINYNDDPIKGLAWLTRYQNPYQFTMVDDKGKLGIDLGVYGAPETFLVDANGVIQFKHVGIVTRDLWDNTLSPLIQQLRENTKAKH